ncbi:MAG: radical SAM protein [bacterium]
MYWLDRLGTKMRNLRVSNSAPWGAVLSRALTILPDYRWGKGRSRRLVNLTLETTYRCNLRCSFCFLRDNRLNRRCEELHMGEIEHLADQARALGCSIYITGGEPFLRRDGVEIVEAIKARGVHAGVNTNGTLLDETRVRRLVSAGLDYVIVSIHGGAAFHDSVVQRNGTFERAAETLRQFGRHKGQSHVLVNFVLTQQSAEQFRAVVDLCAETGADALTVQHRTFLTGRDLEAHARVWPHHFGREEVQLICSLHRPNGGESDRIARGVRQCRAYAEERKVCCIVKPELAAPMLDTWYSEDYRVDSSCFYPWTDTRVAPDGQVYACQFIPYPVGNIRESGLAELLNNERYRRFRLALKSAGGQFPGCARCCKLYRGGLRLDGTRRRGAGAGAVASVRVLGRPKERAPAERVLDGRLRPPHPCGEDREGGGAVQSRSCGQS